MKFYVFGAALFSTLVIFVATSLANHLAAPAGLQTIGVTDTSVALNWDPLASRNYYEVERNGVIIGQSNGVGDPDGGTSAHTDSGLTACTSYTYRVRGDVRLSKRDPHHKTAWSSPVTATTTGCAPTPTPTPTATPTPTPPSDFTLVFSDDFNGTALGSDWEKYGATEDWPGHGGNGLRVGRAVSVHDGLADITAKEVNNVIESGAFTMKNSAYRLTYGRYETRIRVDADPSQTMSAVALLWNVDESAHPWCQGESDFYETGTTRDDWHTFLHWEIGTNPSCSDATTQEHCTHLSDPTQWHDVALEWGPSRYAVYVDGTLDCLITNSAHIPQWPQRLTFQLDAIDSDMGSAVVHMQMDYARIYSLN